MNFLGNESAIRSMMISSEVFCLIGPSLKQMIEVHKKQKSLSGKRPWKGERKSEVASYEREIKKPPCIKKESAGRLFLTFEGTKVLSNIVLRMPAKVKEKCRDIQLGGLVMGINVSAKPYKVSTQPKLSFSKKDTLSFW